MPAPPPKKSTRRIWIANPSSKRHTACVGVEAGPVEDPRLLDGVAVRCHNLAMGKTPLDIASLSRDERLTLIEELWESLDSSKAVPVTPAQRAELTARSDALKCGRLETLSVDDVLEAIRSRHVQG